VLYTKIVDHAVDAGALPHQSLARWWHTVAFSETQDVLHWVIHPTLYRRTRMVTNIASNLPVFFLSWSILIVPTTVDKDHVMVIII
jgi:hypothetical protein